MLTNVCANVPVGKAHSKYLFWLKIFVDFSAHILEDSDVVEVVVGGDGGRFSVHVLSDLRAGERANAQNHHHPHFPSHSLNTIGGCYQ